VDTTPPETTIRSGPAHPTTSRRATFTFAANEPGSTFRCSLDGAAFTACSSPRTYTGLSYAWHTFRVRAVDAAGNVDPTPADWTWRIRRNLSAGSVQNEAARSRRSLGVRSAAWKAARNWLKRCRATACSRT
jgi:hypothetical protein